MGDDGEVYAVLNKMHLAVHLVPIEARKRLARPMKMETLGHGLEEFRQIFRPAFSQYGSRSLRLKILPESSRGNSLRNSTTFGTL